MQTMQQRGQHAMQIKDSRSIHLSLRRNAVRLDEIDWHNTSSNSCHMMHHAAAAIAARIPQASRNPRKKT